MMDFEQPCQRFYTFMRHKLGDTAKQIFEDLHAVTGDSCAGKSTVYRWIKEFSDEKTSSTPSASRGPPISVRSEQTIASVKAHVEEDPHSTVRELSDTSGLSIGTVHKILHEHLHMKKMAARWVPHLLTDEQKKRRVDCSRNLLESFEPNGPKRLYDVVTGDETWITFYGIPNKRCNSAWVGPGGDRPTVLRPGFQSRKRLFTVFFNSSGLVALDILPEKTTVTAKYYTEVVLPKVEDSICEQRPTIKTSKTLLLHDNAAPHKAKLTTTYLNERGISVLEHPPYSPDLAPCDFWLFPILKNRLAGRKFDRAQDLAKAVKLELLSIPKEQYQRAFQSWLRRLEKCVQVQGEYFEGM